MEPAVTVPNISTITVYILVDIVTVSNISTVTIYVLVASAIV